MSTSNTPDIFDTVKPASTTAPVIDVPQSTAIAPVVPDAQKLPIAMGETGLQLSSFNDLWRFAKCIKQSGFAPKGMEREESIVVAIQHGLEIGLPPMQALQSIAVINGRPGLFGDVALALVRASGKAEVYKEEMIGTEGKDDYGCRATTKRKGQEIQTQTFTVADAKKAGLWGKAGPWTNYFARMLKWRARGFLLRDVYGDVLKGLRTVEELQDIAPAAPPPEPLKLASSVVAAPMPATDLPLATEGQAHE